MMPLGASPYFTVLGAAIAVGFAYVLRGPGGGRAGSAAAQGDLYTMVEKPEQA
jgi:aquaporin Z